METTQLSPRKPRIDGVESRRSILDAAARLATTHGLQGLSIGELATHIGMSKSGLYAHFKSKEELLLATIARAAEIFEEDVARNVPVDAHGLARVFALSEAFLDHLARRVFPGGCFFATTFAEFAVHPGRVRDRILEVKAVWLGQFVAALEQAQCAGEIAADADVEQLVFEITSVLFSANFTWIISEEPAVLEQARVGVRHALERVKVQPRDERLPGILKLS